MHRSNVETPLATRPSRFRGHFLMIAGALVLAACDADGPARLTAPAPPRPAADLIPPGSQTLWDQRPPQPAVIITTGSGPLLFADDFVVPTGSRWTITDMILSLAAVDFTIPPKVAIRSTVNGQPGPIVWDQPVTILDTESLVIGSHVRVGPPAPIALGPGKYWLAIELGVSVFGWFSTPLESGSPIHISGDGGQTWLESTPHVGFGLFGSAETVASETTDLITTVEGFGLDAGLTNALKAKLRAALDAVRAGDTAGACSALNAFANQGRGQLQLQPVP